MLFVLTRKLAIYLIISNNHHADIGEAVEMRGEYNGGDLNGFLGGKGKVREF